MVDEGALAGHVALEHGTDLRDRHVGLVDDEQEVVGEVVEQGVRGRAGPPPVDVARVVLHPGARPDLAEHLQVEGGAHAQALGLEELALPLEPGDPLLHLLLDGADRALHALLPRDVVRGGEEVGAVDLVDDIAGEGVQHGQGVDLVPEHLDADGELLVHGDDLDGVAAHAEGAAREGHVVAHVLHGDEAAQQGVAVDPHAALQLDHAGHVLLGGAQAVDAGHRGHDDGIAAGEQGVRGTVAQALHLVVDGGVLLDERVGLGDVGLGLVVVVVGDEVLDGVVRQQLPELGGQLGGQGLVGLEDERGALQLLDEPRGGRGLASAGRAHEDHVLLAVADPGGEFLDRLGLVPRRRVLGDDFEGALLAEDGFFAHPPTLRHSARPR